MKNSLTACHILGKQSELAKEDSKQLFEQPLNFVRKVRRGNHIVLFYEEAEFLKSGLLQNQLCNYISEKETELVRSEMSDVWAGFNGFLYSKQLLVHQIPNLASYSHIPPMALDRLSHVAIHPWTNDSQPNKVVLKCIFRVNTAEQMRSNLKW